MADFASLRRKTYCYLTDDENKKAKATKKGIIKRTLKFDDCKYCLEATHLENKINHLEKKISFV